MTAEERDEAQAAETRFLEAPDLEPKAIFDPTSILMIAAFSLLVGSVASVRLGALGAVFAALLTGYALYRLQRFVVTKFPPGYFADKRLWLSLKAYYYPGKPKRYPPLVREE